MKLEIGNFFVKNIVFGPKTSFKDGVLTVNKEEAIAVLNPAGKLTNVDLHIARPGEKVRILPVKAAVEPRARPDGRVTFPGYTGITSACGNGKLYALKNMSVMAVGKYGGWAEGLIDMSGPAADLSHYAEIMHLIFTADNVDPTENIGCNFKSNADYRIGSLLLAEYIGKTVLEQAPEEWETYELADVREKKLPRVALVAQVSTPWDDDPTWNDRLYGVGVRNLIPTLIHPNEILDGAFCASSLAPACSKNFTYSYQNYPMLKKLYSQHGKEIDFAGVIMCGFSASEEKKESDAIRSTNIARLLNCDGIIFTQVSGGNSDVDFFLTQMRMEEAGIKSVGICSENPGRDGATQPKLILDARVDAIVSTGSNAQVIELPAMDKVIGDIYSIGRDSYPSAWANDEVFGPSLRPDGSLIVDRRIIHGHDGMYGWSHKTCKGF